MKQIKKEKAFWNKYFNFSSIENIPPAIQQINLRCTEVNDEDIYYLVGRIKKIEILELDETQISNTAIKPITQLVGLKELRLKDNDAINNDCIADLNLLTSLEMLHVGHTSITLDGVMQLAGLQNLKRLFFSAKNDEVTYEKMLQLQSLLPHCSFIINNKPYDFNHP